MLLGVKISSKNNLFCSSFTANFTLYFDYTYNGKEKDYESGFHYYGSRYYSSELSIWNSTDPMADKYPSLAPYNYCANNPVKLIDPNGEEIWIVGENSDQVVEKLQTKNLTIKRDTQTGLLSYEGKAKHKYEKMLVKAIDSKEISIHIQSVVSQNISNENTEEGFSEYRGSFVFEKNGLSYKTNGGSFMGTEKNGNKVNTYQVIDCDLLYKNGYTQGVPHEVTESFFAGQYSLKHNIYGLVSEKITSESYINRDKIYNYAHEKAIPQFFDENRFFGIKTNKPIFK